MKRAVLVVILVLAVGIVVSAVPGVLDTSFNGSGLATTDFAIAGIGNFHVATAVGVDSRNRPVAVGRTTAGPDITIYDVAIARYNADGTPDTTFNGTGKVIRDFGGDDRAAAVAIDNQDRILVAGSTDWKPGCNAASCGGNFNFFLARFNVDGSIDASFGDNGRTLVDMGSDDDWATAMVVDPAGRIVVAGWTSQGHAEIAMMRVLPSGALDSSFDGDGIVVSDLSPSFFAATSALTLDRFGRLIITADIGGFTGVFRYQSNGSLDQQFHDVVIGDHPETGCSYASLRAVAVDSSDRIVATGYCAGDTFEGPGIETLTVRLLPQGGFDPGFGQDGMIGGVLSHFGAAGEQGAMALALGPIGEITIAGVAQGCGSDMLLARYEPTGALDTHFAADGSGSTLINFDPACSDDRANAMATDAHGNFVLAGSTMASGNSDFAVARVLTYHPDFSFSPVTAIDLAPGGSGSTTLTINSIDGFHEFLKIAPFAGVPAGFTWAFDGYLGALSITPPAFGSVNTTFGVTVGLSVVPGPYEMAVFDERLRDIAHTAVVTVNVVTTPLSFARTISGFTQEGFIDDEGIASGLTRLLDNASSSLAAGNVDAALDQLRALKNHVNAQAGKHIATVATEGGQTINPAAILLANADDLIRQAGGG